MPDSNGGAIEDSVKEVMKEKNEQDVRSHVEIINPDELGKPRGYSNGVKARGSLLAIAGQVAWDCEQRIVSDNFTAQFAQALENFVTVLRAAGGEPGHVIQMRLFVIDKREYAGQLKTIGEAYRERMGRHYPAMTLVEVKGLLEERAKIEIEGLALIPEKRARRGAAKSNRKPAS
jgi:enamine deaminase RidA (YjgF/YER057c/UK114 family)